MRWCGVRRMRTPFHSLHPGRLQRRGDGVGGVGRTDDVSTTPSSVCAGAAYIFVCNSVIIAAVVRLRPAQPVSVPTGGFIASKIHLVRGHVKLSRRVRPSNHRTCSRSVVSPSLRRIKGRVGVLDRCRERGIFVQNTMRSIWQLRRVWTRTVTIDGSYHHQGNKLSSTWGMFLPCCAQ